MTEQPPLPAEPPRGYWRETRQPIYSAWLVLPFLLIYEAGLLVMKSDVINGGDAILLSLGGSLMRLLGVHASFISVIVLIGVFIGAQIKRKGSWRARPPLVAAMFFESLLYAVLLFMLLGFIVPYLPRDRERADAGGVMIYSVTDDEGGRDARGTQVAAQIGHSGNRPGPRDFVLYCGAGVYEELVFRVLLLGLLLLVFTKLFHMEHAYAAAWSVLAGAIIFSAFHHIGGEEFFVGVFMQRVVAGLYFAAIYFNRSFGLAAASHALYDILVGLNQYV